MHAKGLAASQPNYFRNRAKLENWLCPLLRSRTFGTVQNQETGMAHYLEGQQIKQEDYPSEMLQARRDTTVSYFGCKSLLLFLNPRIYPSRKFLLVTFFPPIHLSILGQFFLYYSCALSSPHPPCFLVLRSRNFCKKKCSDKFSLFKKCSDLGAQMKMKSKKVLSYRCSDLIKPKIVLSSKCSAQAQISKSAQI